MFDVDDHSERVRGKVNEQTGVRRRFHSSKPTLTNSSGFLVDFTVHEEVRLLYVDLMKGLLPSVQRETKSQPSYCLTSVITTTFLSVFGPLLKVSGSLRLLSLSCLIRTTTVVVVFVVAMVDVVYDNFVSADDTVRTRESPGIRIETILFLEIPVVSSDNEIPLVPLCVQPEFHVGKNKVI